MMLSSRCLRMFAEQAAEFPLQHLGALLQNLAALEHGQPLLLLRDPRRLGQGLHSIQLAAVGIPEEICAGVAEIIVQYFVGLFQPARLLADRRPLDNQVGVEIFDVGQFEDTPSLLQLAFEETRRAFESLPVGIEIRYLVPDRFELAARGPGQLVLTQLVRVGESRQLAPKRPGPGRVPP